MTTGKSTLRHVVSGCVVRSEHHIDMLSAELIMEEHLNIFITEPSIEQTVYFWDSVKKEPPEEFYENAVIKNFAICTGKLLCWSLFSLGVQVFNLLKETPTQLFSPEYGKKYNVWLGS